LKSFEEELNYLQRFVVCDGNELQQLVGVVVAAAAVEKSSRRKVQVVDLTVV
jgi:hypothetical protein